MFQFQDIAFSRFAVILLEHLPMCERAVDCNDIPASKRNKEWDNPEQE